MADESPATVEQAQANRPPRIVYADTERIHSPRFMFRMALGGVVGTLITGGAGLVAFVVGESPSLIGLLAMAALMAVTACVFGVIGAVIRSRWLAERRIALHLLNQRDGLDLQGAVNALLVDMAGVIPPGLREPAPDDPAHFQQRLRSLGFDPAVAIVDSRLRSEIESITREREFVEPAVALSQARRFSPWMRVLMAALLIVGLSMLAPAFIDRDPLSLMIGLGILVMLGIPLARSFGARVGESTAPVVGIGVVSDHTGRRWSVTDSCLFIRRMRMDSHIVLVDLVGPAGDLSLRYWGIDDAGFRLLWQRWMHPNPRPELG